MAEPKTKKNPPIYVHLSEPDRARLAAILEFYEDGTTSAAVRRAIRYLAVNTVPGALRKLIEPAAGLIADDHINLGLNDGWALKLAVDATRAALEDSEPEEGK